MQVKSSASAPQAKGSVRPDKCKAQNKRMDTSGLHIRWRPWLAKHSQQLAASPDQTSLVVDPPTKPQMDSLERFPDKVKYNIENLNKGAYVGGQGPHYFFIQGD
uniref:Uncharacterized protein n=1 Tax=Ananas comosus var. bracteatus TaxID=296719 RepID=A0A6V7PYU7_ANACO|nr:unnamed protein product [Ananas comosus var. bracteatus]